MEKKVIVDVLKYKMRNQLGIINEDIVVSVILGIGLYYLLHMVFMAITIAALYLFFNLEIIKNVKIMQLISYLINYLVRNKQDEITF